MKHRDLKFTLLRHQPVFANIKNNIVPVIINIKNCARLFLLLFFHQPPPDHPLSSSSSVRRLAPGAAPEGGSASFFLFSFCFFYQVASLLGLKYKRASGFGDKLCYCIFQKWLVNVFLLKKSS